jgi:predicted Zn-dependent protease
MSHGLEVAENLLLNEENRLAIETLDSLKGRFGDQKQIRLLLAKAYRQLGNKDAFERQLELGESMGLSAETVQAEKLLFLAQLGMLETPESKIAEFIDTHPQDFDAAARALVFGLLRQQDTQRVDRFLPMWQTQSPDAPWIPTFRAMTYLTKRDWKGALQEIEPALKKHPSFVPLYLQAGIAYQGDQQFELAESMLDRYLNSQPDNAEALLRYSEVLRKLGKASLALERIKRSIESFRDPDRQIQPSLTLQIAKLYLDTEENQKVIDTLDRLSREWPEDVEIASTLSQAYQRLGDESRSAAYAEIADAGQKQTVLADRMLFELLSNPNRTAQQCYDLGHLLLHKQSRESGLYWLEAALTLDENFTPAHEDLVLYYQRTGQGQLADVHKRYIRPPAKP